MSINKERIRAKLAALQGGNNSYWNPPKNGQATIRAFAVPDGEDEFLELYFHFGVAEKASVYCLRKNRDESGREGKCPICEQADEWYNGDEDEKALSKNIYSKPRFYIPVIDRADKSPQPKWWGFSKTVYGKMLHWLAEDADRENFLDPDEGLDLIVIATQTGKSINGRPVSDIDVNTRLKSTPICAKKDQESLFKALKPASELFPRPSLQEVQGKLESYLRNLGEGDDSPEPVESEGVSKGAPRRVSDDEINAMLDAAAQ